MKALILAAALAATAFAVPVAPASAASPTAAIPPSDVNELSHVRTALYGRSGPLVVLIPGMSTPGAMWDGTVAALERDHRLLVVEVKGFDGKDAPANRGDGLIAGIVGDIGRDLAQRRLGKAILVGHSFGGLVAMKLALDHPDAVRSLVVVDALPFFGTVMDPKATVESVRPRAAAMREMMVKQAAVIRAMAAKPIAKDPGGTMSIDPKTRTLIAGWSMRADPEVVAQAMWEDVLLDLRQAIAGLKPPLTVLYQAHENAPLAAQRYGTDYAAKADARLVAVDKTGHFIPLDRPDVVLDAIRAASGR